MRSLCLFFAFCTVTAALCGCRKSSKSTPETYVANITKSHLWSGSESKSIDAYSCGTDTFNHSYNDTVCSITEVNDTTISISLIGLTLTYNNTNTTAGTVTYIGGSQNDESAKLTYYYAVDSMVFSYSGIAGSEHCGYDDVYHIGYFFHTHR
jgi:hypothetical protein